jgi:hypothetical protein
MTLIPINRYVFELKLILTSNTSVWSTHNLHIYVPCNFSYRIDPDIDLYQIRIYCLVYIPKIQRSLTCFPVFLSGF